MIEGYEHFINAEIPIPCDAFTDLSLNNGKLHVTFSLKKPNIERKERLHENKFYSIIITYIIFSFNLQLSRFI